MDIIRDRAAHEDKRFVLNEIFKNLFVDFFFKAEILSFQLYFISFVNQMY